MKNAEAIHGSWLVGTHPKRERIETRCSPDGRRLVIVERRNVGNIRVSTFELVEDPQWCGSIRSEPGGGSIVESIGRARRLARIVIARE